MTARVKVPFAAWHADEPLELPFPEGFSVQLLPPCDAPALTSVEIAAAFAAPIRSAPLREIAASRKRAVIAVDDITRPTPAHQLLPHVVGELEAGGMPRERIQILLGTAAHRPMSRSEIERKLGVEIARRYRVLAHDFMGSELRDLGWHRGGPVHLNRNFVDADLRVCVGGVIPHNETGFGGGAKMVVPGVAGELTIAHFHGALPPRPAGVVEASSGQLDRRAWSESVARWVGVDAVVAAALNSRREVAGLYVGDLVAAHRKAAARALEIGRTPVPAAWARECDIVVVNAYPLDSDPVQMGKSFQVAKRLAPRCTVIVNAASDGIFYHGMGMGSGVHVARLGRGLRRWLTSWRRQRAWLAGMARAFRHPIALPARVSYFALNGLDYAEFSATEERLALEEDTPAARGMGDPLVFSRCFPSWGLRRKFPRGELYRDWEQLCGVLANRYPNARVLVLPCAPLQLLAFAESVS